MKFQVQINGNIPNLCPKKDQIFRALDLTPINTVKVVILGEQPYHGENLANGLAFSVNKNMMIPPSLRNIFKELKDDLGIENTHGDLTKWAKQGVLLLNSVLTTETNNPGVHFNKGWETYTDTIIRQISDEREKVIFLLWGKKAQEKKSLINKDKHVIVESSLPSEEDFHGDFGYISELLKEKIDWSLD